MNLSWIFVFFLYKTVLNPLRCEINFKTIGRLNYRDDTIIVSRNQEKRTEFFFTPFPSFQSIETQCYENIFTDHLELGLRIELYTSDMMESVKEYLYKHYSNSCGDKSVSFQCDISLLPMSSFRIIQRNTRLNGSHNKYTLDESWQSASSLSQSIKFRLYPSNTTVCEKIRSALIDQCYLPDFEFQYTIHDKQRISKELEVTTEHITNTVLYRRIHAQFSSSETIMLTDRDFKQLINESIERITIALRLKQDFADLEDLQSLEKHLEQELSTQHIRLGADNNKLWKNLYWNSHSTRPDQLAKILNSIIQKDHMNDDNFLYYHQNAINHSDLAFTPHDMYPTQLTESDFEETNMNQEEDEDSAESNQTSSQQIKKQNKINTNTNVVVRYIEKTNHPNTITHQMVVDYLRKLSDDIYLDQNDNIIKSHSINVRLIRLNKFKRNKTLFSTTVLAKVQPHLYTLPVQCQSNSWIKDRLKNNFVNLTNQTSRIRNESSKENECLQTIKQLNTKLLENNETIQELKIRLDELEKKKTKPLIRPGKPFGGLGGVHFNDSASLSLNSSYYLSGIRFSEDLNNLDACQFIYTSIHDHQNQIYSNVHGNYGKKIDSSKVFYLDKNEKILRIEVQTAEEGFYLGGDRTRIFMIKLIKGLKFITTKGRIIPPDSHLTGFIEKEYYPGYVLGYATGRSGLRIDQIQFHWFRENS